LLLLLLLLLTIISHDGLPTKIKQNDRHTPASESQAQHQMGQHIQLVAQT
jgi:hypothetical protein